MKHSLLKKFLEKKFNSLFPKIEFYFYEPFSVIHSRSIDPDLPIEGYFDEPYNKEFFAVTIRRALQYKDIRSEIPKTTQRNAALYERDIVVLNYHNLFCLLNSQLKIDFYLFFIRIFKIFCALLHHYDILIYNTLKSIDARRLRYRELKKLTNELENLRIDTLRVLYSYKILSSVSATRARLFMSKCIDTFHIEDLVNSLRDKIDALEDQIGKQYNLELQKRLQLFTIILTIIAILVTIFGLIGIDRLLKWFEIITRSFGFEAEHFVASLLTLTSFESYNRRVCGLLTLPKPLRASHTHGTSSEITGDGLNK